MKDVIAGNNHWSQLRHAAGVTSSQVAVDTAPPAIADVGGRHPTAMMSAGRDLSKYETACDGGWHSAINFRSVTDRALYIGTFVVPSPAVRDARRRKAAGVDVPSADTRERQ